MNFLQIALFLLSSFLFAEDKIEITKDSNILIYSSYFWAPCDEAKSLLKSRGIDFKEKKVTFSRKNTEAMTEISGGKFGVPQLVIDGKYFGGLKDLKDYFANK